MKPCWDSWGLTEEGAERAERVIGKMLEIFAEVNDEGALLIVFGEAKFRHFDLPTRTAEYQERYKKENG